MIERAVRELDGAAFFRCGKRLRLRGFVETALDPREREIVTLRYGLGNRTPLPQRTVAQRLGISRSYVSRLEKRALEKLRRSMEREDGP